MRNRPGTSGGGAFNILAFVSAAFTMAILLAIVITLVAEAYPAIMESGPGFIFNKDWDPVRSQFGALPFILGTLITSFTALLISLPVSLSVAVLLSQFLKKGIFSEILRITTELLAGIPSVVYGFWGLLFIVPLSRKIQIFFGLPPTGIGFLPAALILSIMIIPYSASIAREVLQMVPDDLKEGAYSLGATDAEVICKVSIPYASSGITAGIILALGRALGETMAVTMVIGNSNILPKNLLGPGNTLASVIANEFAEATDVLHSSSLIYLGLVLLLTSFAVNFAGRYIVRKVEGRYGKN